MAEKLDDDAVRAGLDRLGDGWRREGDEIERVFELDSFPAALEFVERVGELAETANHHPDIDIRYRNVRIALTTHDAGGLTEKDFALAAQVDAAATGA